MYYTTTVYYSLMLEGIVVNVNHVDDFASLFVSPLNPPGGT
jgi:hypothetical protein